MKNEICNCVALKGKIPCQLRAWREAIKHPSSWTKEEMQRLINKYEPICRKQTAPTEEATMP